MPKPIKEEKIPFKTLGHDRSIYMEDLGEKKERSKARRRKIREELTDEAQDLGLGY